MIRVLKCFVTSTLAYTAQVDESVLYICFIMLLSICVELALSVLLVIRVLKCFVTPTLTSTAQVDEKLLHIGFDCHYIIEYMLWTCFTSTASVLRYKMLCYADFNIRRSSWRKCVTHLLLLSIYYWVYALNLFCKYCWWFAF